jgi:hypothetical protein
MKDLSSDELLGKTKGHSSVNISVFLFDLEKNKLFPRVSTSGEKTACLSDHSYI